MNLYIKQKVFSWNDRYQVYNENGQPVFEVEGELFSWGAKIHLYQNNHELFYIQQKLMRFLPEYEIYAGEQLCARVKKELSFFVPKLNVESAYGNFVIQGEFFNMDFSIWCNEQQVGEVHKEWLSWGDSYCLSVNRPENGAFFTSLVIAIDHCIHNENHN